MPVAKIHVLEGQYNEARIGKVSSAIQNGLISALIPCDQTKEKVIRSQITECDSRTHCCANFCVLKYLHDGRALTLEDTVEFFNLVLELKLTPEEKHNLVEFMRQL
jgi:hypothetical protein